MPALGHRHRGASGRASLHRVDGQHRARLVTHVAYAPIALFPDLGKGDLLAELDDTGVVAGAYRVIDCKPWGDGRLEWAISLAVA